MIYMHSYDWRCGWPDGADLFSLGRDFAVARELARLPWGGWPDGTDLFALGRDFTAASFGAGGYAAIYPCISGLYPRLDGFFTALDSSSPASTL
jgi:hypothetical protein